MWRQDNARLIPSPLSGNQCPRTRGLPITHLHKPAVQAKSKKSREQASDFYNEIR